MAIGQRVAADFYPEKSIKINYETYETGIENVFAGGDATRGASTLINAIADGKKAAFSIIKKTGKKRQVEIAPKSDRKPDIEKLMIARAKRDYGQDLSYIPPQMKTDDKKGAEHEAARCLECDIICNICTTVCPNRSNIYYKTEPVSLPVEIAKRIGSDVKTELSETVNIKQPCQVVNIGDFCNECGNCETFCPSAGAPYKDKPKLHLKKESFVNSVFGFYFDEKKEMKIKTEKGVSYLRKKGDEFFYENEDISVTLNAGTLRASKVELRNKSIEEINIGHIPEYVVLYRRFSDGI